MNARQVYQAMYQAAKKQDTKALKRALKFAPLATPQIIDGKYFASPLSQVAFEKDEKAVQFLLKNGGEVSDAVEGYLMAGETTQEIEKRLTKQKIKFDAEMIQDASGFVQAFNGQEVVAPGNKKRLILAYALGGHVDKVNALLKDDKGLLLAAVHGYAISNDVNKIAEAYNLLSEADGDELQACFRVLSQAFVMAGDEKRFKDILNEMVTDSDKETLIEATIHSLQEKGNFSGIDFLVERTTATPKTDGEKFTSVNHRDVKNINLEDNVQEQLAQIHQQRENKAKTVIQEQYEKQEKNKKLRIAYVVLAAIFLTPLSLAVSLPLYFRAENNDPIKKLKTTNDELTQVKQKRETLRVASGALKLKQYDKPKKVDLTDLAKPNERVFLVDKSQYERFKLFAKQDFKDLKKQDANDMAKQLEESKTTSRVRMMYSN